MGDYEDSSSYGSTLSGEENPHKNSIEFARMDSSNTIRDMDMELRGWELEPLTNIWTKPKAGKGNKFGMSDSCRSYIIYKLREVLTPTNVQANFSKKFNGLREYEWNVNSRAESFEQQLLNKKEEFGLDIIEINDLATMYQETIRTFFTRALGDGERTRDKADETYVHKDDITASKGGFTN